MKVALIFLALAMLVTVSIVSAAPRFLFVEKPPLRSDAVILFVGPGNEARLDEARKLITEGYARLLIIPYRGEIHALDRSGALVRISDDSRRSDLIRKVRFSAAYPKYFENTHIEAMEARRLMDEFGCRSALLVSSGYHMRRISLIAGKVFGKQYRTGCNPARWQQPFTASDWFDRERRNTIISEYGKIGWFLVYGVFHS